MKKLSHKFIEFMPEPLDDGVLYISLRFCLVTHKCCCGCGEEVVLKLSPNDWNLTFDGESISINPSIGNWGLKCQSHYWIKNSRVRWAPRWSDEKIRHERELPRLSSRAGEGSDEHKNRHLLPRGKGGFLSKVWRKLRDRK